MTVEAYIPSKHWKFVHEWYAKRGLADFIREGSFPPVGSVAVNSAGEPVMVGFLYMAIGCNTCFVERIIGRPSLRLADAREAGRLILSFLRGYATTCGYQDMFSHLDTPVLVGELEKLGFARTPGSGILMHYDLQAA